MSVRRDITIVRVSDHGTIIRYWLSNGWWIDKAKTEEGYHLGWKCSLWEPGAGPRGTAACLGTAERVGKALRLARHLPRPQ